MLKWLKKYISIAALLLIANQTKAELACLVLCTRAHVHAHTLLLAIVWELRWKGSSWPGGQSYWPVDVWVESELGFPTVPPSTQGLIPSVNNRSVPWMNKQELSCPGTEDVCKKKKSWGFFDEVFFFFGITEITGHKINAWWPSDRPVVLVCFSSLVKVMQHQDDSHYRSRVQI